jgi:competence protein ComEC
LNKTLRRSLAVARDAFVSGWQEDWARRFNWFPVLLGVGIGLYFSLPVEPAAYLAVLALLPPIAYVVARGAEAGEGVTVGAAALAAVALGFGLAIARVHLLATVTLTEETRIVEVSGQISSAEPTRKNRLRVLLDAASIEPAIDGPAPTRVRVSIAKAPEGLRPGDWIRVPAVLRPLPAPVAPGSYDFARTLWFDGIGAVGFSMGEAERIAPAAADGWIERFALWMASVRRATSDRIRSHLDERTGPIAVAFLTGERTLITDEDQQAMRDSSLSHLLSISGLHMALAGFGFLAALRLIFALIPSIALNYPVKKWAAIAALFASFGYLMLSGASIPAVRSFIMIAVAFVAIVADRPAISLRVVALAALAILVVMPESWIDPSFQMSFGAVVGLVSAYEWWRDRDRTAALQPVGYLGRVRRVLGATAATSFVAGLASAPFAAYHFNRFANYGIAANLLAMPVVSFVIMPAGVIALLLMPLGLDGPALQAMGWGIGVMLDVAHWVASWPGATWRVTTMPDAALIAMVAGGLWLALWRSRWRLAGVLAIVAGLTFSFFGSAPDLIVAADGRNLAVRGADGQLHLLSARRGVFGAEQWLRRDADARTVTDAASGGGIFACDASGCVVKIAGREDRRLLYARSADALSEDCEGAAVLIDQTRGWRPPCGAPMLVISSKMLRREGAIAVTLEGEGLRWTSVERERGVRPWTSGWRRRQ